MDWMKMINGLTVIKGIDSHEIDKILRIASKSKERTACKKNVNANAK
jgi:hypothetical protein